MSPFTFLMWHQAHLLRPGKLYITLILLNSVKNLVCLKLILPYSVRVKLSQLLLYWVAVEKMGVILVLPWPRHTMLYQSLGGCFLYNLKPTQIFNNNQSFGYFFTIEPLALQVFFFYGTFRTNGQLYSFQDIYQATDYERQMKA